MNMGCYCKRAIFLLCALLMLFVNINGTCCYIVSNSQSLKNVFVGESAPQRELVKVEITVNKTVKGVGKNLPSPEGFIFVLKNEATKEELTAESNDMGKAVFELEFTAEEANQSHSFTLSEKNTGRENISYSKRCYEIRVDVFLDTETNGLAAKVYADSKPVNTESIFFENTYDKGVQTGDNRKNVVWTAIFAISLVLTALFGAFMRKIKA